MDLTRPSLDAYSALRDFITDPSGFGLPFARRMALRMTARIPNPEISADMHERLCVELETLVGICNLIPDIYAIDEAQESARETLEVCRKLGRQ